MVHNSRDMETKRLSADDWVRKLLSNYTRDYCSALKKKEVLPFPTRMNMEDVVPSAVRQAQKDRYHTITLTCGI